MLHSFLLLSYFSLPAALLKDENIEIAFLPCATPHALRSLRSFKNDLCCQCGIHETLCELLTCTCSCETGARISLSSGHSAIPSLAPISPIYLYNFKSVQSYTYSPLCPIKSVPWISPTLIYLAYFPPASLTSQSTKSPPSPKFHHSILVKLLSYLYYFHHCSLIKGIMCHVTT